MTTYTALPAAPSTRFGLPLICLVLTLAGCAGQGPYHEPTEPDWEPPHEPSRQPPAVQTPPQQRPMPPAQPQPPKQAPRMKAHPRFAPPPGGNCYWDTGLGVYVLEAEHNVFYRERVYYRWDNGWSYSNGPHGPWQPTDSSGVPAGLGRHFQ
ncbi:hypothetical protein [Pseudomonas sp. BN102]|uniref:hypothetical protein n=1 Tax=Pseudomonas sp. BN102 TaxID=2567886 RepID=UPI0024539578|nr:hypothetical protein [Pseudomonas sp. BN102]MDH4612068.1 hypothetical protein [Pseudomonas sp. BN102]